MFILQVSIDGLDKTLIDKQFLPINKANNFTKIFYCDFQGIREKLYFWKLFTALFLHPHAMSLLSSAVTILIWASMFERLVKPIRLMLYFIVGGIVGNLFALAVSGTNAELIGANVGIFSVFGAVLAYLLYNWNNMEKFEHRIFWIIFILIILLLSLIFADPATLVSCLTGFCSGLFVGFCLSEKFVPKGTVDTGRTEYEKTFIILGISILLSIVVPSFLVIFLTSGSEVPKKSISF